MSIEKTVSIGILISLQEELEQAIEKKKELFRMSYNFIREVNPKFKLPNTFEECTIEQLDNIKKSSKFKQLHAPYDSVIEKARKVTNVKQNLLLGTLLFKIKKELKTLERKARNDEYLLIGRCVPEWYRPYVAPVYEKEKKKKQRFVIEEKQVDKEYKKGIHWMQVDIRNIDFIMVDGIIVWEDPIKGVQFPSGTVFSDIFPEDFNKIPRWGNRIENNINKRSLARLATARLLAEKQSKQKVG